MRVKTLQVLWHDKDPIFSVDFEPNGSGRFATAGGDHNVRIWRLEKDEKELPTVQFLSSLDRHAGAVNCVRWAPGGGVLASGGDDGTIILWVQSDEKAGTSTLEDQDGQLETWRCSAMLRGSTNDIMDMAWSPDGLHLMAGCVDNTSRIFAVKEQRGVKVMTEHGHFVQGVAWDPLGKYLVSQSSDRSIQVYTSDLHKNQLRVKAAGRLTRVDPSKCASRGETMSTAQPSESIVKPLGKPFRNFHDETLASFFRRLTFSPDGSLLFAPAGVFRSEGEDVDRNAVYVYGRGQITGEPIACLCGHAKPSIAVRCSPVAYKLRPMNRTMGGDIQPPSPPAETPTPSPPPSMFALRYRYIFAVATQDALFIYDTQQPDPIAHLSGLHYSTLTDVAWSTDGRTILMTSTDGFCSIVSFEEGQLGEAVEEEALKFAPSDDAMCCTPPLSPSREGPVKEGLGDAMEGVVVGTTTDKVVAPSGTLLPDNKRPGTSGAAAPSSKKRRIAPTFLRPCN